MQPPLPLAGLNAPPPLAWEHLAPDEVAERKRIVLHKPSFILEQLRENPEATFWLDCDPSLEALPSLPWEKERDVGFLPNTLRRRIPGLFRQFGIGPRPRRD